MRISMAILLAMLLPATALADAPATRPSVKVAVMPFDVLGDAGRVWMGQALQQGLAMGLQKTAGFSAVIVPGMVPADADAALAAAKAVDADAVIFGVIQLLDNQIRVEGQIVSPKSGQVIGVLESQQNLRGLFDVEDMLSDRAVRLLRPMVRPAAPSGAGGPVPFELVGPAVATRPPSYFDGDLSEVIAKPDRFRDDYDRYYYHSADTAGCGQCWGGPYFGGPICGWGGAPFLASPQATIGTW